MSSASAPATKNRPPVVAAALSVLAAAALIVSLLGPTWVALVGKLDVSFPTLRALTSLDSAPAIQHAYFTWLGWTLTIVVIVGLLAAVLIPVPMVTRASQLLVVLLSLAGVVLTLAAVYQLEDEVPGGTFLKHFGWLRVGGYLHVVGWVLAIIAVVAASRARERNS